MYVGTSVAAMQQPPPRLEQFTRRGSGVMDALSVVAYPDGGLSYRAPKVADTPMSPARMVEEMPGWIAFSAVARHWLIGLCVGGFLNPFDPAAYADVCVFWRAQREAAASCERTGSFAACLVFNQGCLLEQAKERCSWAKCDGFITLQQRSVAHLEASKE
jgi:hypothetical protein